MRLWGLLIFLVASQLSQAKGEKVARCPAAAMNPKLCGDQEDACKTHEDCSGDSICCSTGCSNHCILPLNTACEQVRLYGERRARSLESEDYRGEVFIPSCNSSNGNFEEIQCDPTSGFCYCVDVYTGFEKQGTRAKSREDVNCTNPRKSCLGPTCRMLCSFGFELDEEGCPICSCKDPCNGIKCAGSSKCELLEDLKCLNEPCPPVPTCKEPRSLDSICPENTLPLILPETQKPYLCGRKEEGKPTCPQAFECLIEQGNEYGVCCISFSTMLVEKPGDCPVVPGISAAENGEECASPCDIDFQCSDNQKCCMSEKCGKVCSAPANLTVCLQEKMIAELLSVKEVEGKGYIPQCDENGGFIPRQCSRNGKICWCVDAFGKNFGGMGLAEAVTTCPSPSQLAQSSEQRHRAVEPEERCDKSICSSICEFGYSVDRNGCPTCDCLESCPISCPAGSVCEYVKDPNCKEESCPSIKPTCLSEYVYVNPCEVGTPLTDLSSGKVVTCSAESALTCPESHICVKVSINQGGLCCQNANPRVEDTKSGLCPFLSPSLCVADNNVTNEGFPSKKCTSDKECEGDMKCCGCGLAGAICADPLLPNNDPTTTNKPSMCEYLRDIGGILEGNPQFKLAIPTPECKENGDFEEVQCDNNGACWCVDEFGARLDHVGIRNRANLTREDCYEMRKTPGCLQMNCRLGCDYGYERESGCPICECVNKCKENNCEDHQKCEIVDVDCPEFNAHCPALPYCVPKSVGACPKGEPFMDPTSNETLTCRPRARMLQCPDNFFCYDFERNEDFGLCCPILYDSEDESSSLIAEERSPSDHLDSNILQHLLNDEDILRRLSEDEEEPTRLRNNKIGQCPYLEPKANGGASCEFDCSSDSECEDDLLCCSNGCGTKCAQPIILTACQHLRSIKEHQARESGAFNKVYFPQCRLDDGGFEEIQCDPSSCWCVNTLGQEIEYSRVPPGQRPPCQYLRGKELDPCASFKCDNPQEECRLVQINCITDPCPPLPMCLPKMDNVCQHGEPLKNPLTGLKQSCGPTQEFCPSTHSCSLNPFGEGVCCPKPRSLCFEDPMEGKCSKNVQKWFFNSESNACEEFMGCMNPGNSNNFNSLQECVDICPSLTKCERMREKNLKLNAQTNQLNYVPRCTPGSGEWEPVQCLQEVGLCWCSSKKGDRIKGTMTSGTPNCSYRQSRSRGFSLTPLDDKTTVCPEGVTVHLCNRSLCDNRVCMAKPNASCLIDPCGGCNVKWVDEDNQRVDCEEGLGACHKRVQRVINSPAWINQGMSSVIQEVPPSSKQSEEDPYSALVIENTGPAQREMDTEVNLRQPRPSPFMNMDLDKALKDLLSFESSGSDEESEPIYHKTETKPYFREINGEKVAGLSSSSITIVGGRHRQAEKASGPPGQVQNIADILAEIMRGDDSEGGGLRASLMGRSFSKESSEEDDDKVIDLLPSNTDPFGTLRIPSMDGFIFPEQLASSPSVVRSKRVRALDFDDESASFEDEENLRLPLPFGGSSFNPLRANSEIMISIVRPSPAFERVSCPPPKSLTALLHLLTGVQCPDTCQHDTDCHSSQKCCMADCGFQCVDPIILPEMPPVPNVPIPYFFEGNSLPPLEEEEFLEPIMMEIVPPKCQANGEFEVEQAYGELTYCVSPKTGEPLHESLTKGQVVCSSNGTILQRRSRGAICPDRIPPRVCTDQCLEATCPEHPDAICVADICDQCKVQFYKTSGERVSCEPKCEQVPDAGNCRAAFRKYFYNSTSSRCEEFLYGGCGGNDNNWDTIEECQSKCPDLTSDLVLCPNLVDGAMKTCSRKQACQNLKCGGGQNIISKYNLDPCSCTCTCSTFEVIQIEEVMSIVPQNEASTLKTQESTIPLQETQAIFIDESARVPPIIDIELSDTISVESTPKPNQKKLITLMNLKEIKTRCQKLKEQYFAQCDANGRFSPMQCSETKMKSSCYCVDEAGNQIEGSKVFAEGSGEDCQMVSIQKVNVILSFPIPEETHPMQIEDHMHEILQKLNAQVENDKVELDLEHSAVNLRFALLGVNKIDVSFALEEMVKHKQIGISDPLTGQFTPADISSSRFYHVLIPPVVKLIEKSSQSDNDLEKVLTKDDVFAEEVFVAKEYDSVAVFLMVISALTLILAVIGVFFAFQKKTKGTGGGGSGFKKPFELAFSSYIYEIEKKALESKKLSNPTFKVKSVDEEIKNKEP